MKQYYTTKETARELNTTIRTISRWLKDGIIAGKKPGDTWQIPAREVERMRKVKATDRRGRHLPVKILMS